MKLKSKAIKEPVAVTWEVHQHFNVAMMSILDFVVKECSLSVLEISCYQSSEGIAVTLSNGQIHTLRPCDTLVLESEHLRVLSSAEFEKLYEVISEN